MKAFSAGQLYRMMCRLNPGCGQSPVGRVTLFHSLEPRVLLSGSTPEEPRLPDEPCPMVVEPLQDSSDDAACDVAVSDDDPAPVGDDSTEDQPTNDQPTEPELLAITPTSTGDDQIQTTDVDDEDDDLVDDDLDDDEDDDLDDDEDDEDEEALLVLAGNVEASFQSLTYATSVVQGERGRGKAKVNLTNISDARLPEDGDVTVRLLAVPVAGGEGILLTEKTDDWTDGLRAGRAKTVTLPFTLPENLPAGEYRFAVEVVNAGDPLDQVEAQSEQTFEVEARQINLTAEITRARLPQNVKNDRPAKANVRVQITNEGNTRLGDDQDVDVVVKLRPNDAVDDSQDIIIGQRDDFSIDKLKAGKSKSVNVKVEVPQVAAGQYTLVVSATPQGLEETNTDDNQATLPGPVTVTQAGADLTVGETELEVEQDDDEQEAELEVEIRNQGNVAARGQATVTVRAVDGENSQVVGTRTVELRLAPGRDRTVKIDLQLPEVQELTELNLVVDITTSNITELNSENNSKEVGSVTLSPHIAQTINDVTFTETAAPQTQDGQTTSSGTVTTSNGGTGTYSWNVRQAGNRRQQLVGTLTLELQGEGQPNGPVVIALRFEELAERPVSLDQLKLALSRDEFDDDELNLQSQPVRLSLVAITDEPIVDDTITSDDDGTPDQSGGNEDDVIDDTTPGDDDNTPDQGGGNEDDVVDDTTPGEDDNTPDQGGGNDDDVIDDNTPGGDDGTPDQGGGNDDDVIDDNTPGGDDGTPDQGGDNDDDLEVTVGEDDDNTPDQGGGNNDDEEDDVTPGDDDDTPDQGGGNDDDDDTPGSDDDDDDDDTLGGDDDEGDDEENDDDEEEEEVEPVQGEFKVLSFGDTSLRFEGYFRLTPA